MVWCNGLQVVWCNDCKTRHYRGRRTGFHPPGRARRTAAHRLPARAAPGRRAAASSCAPPMTAAITASRRSGGRPDTWWSTTSMRLTSIRSSKRLSASTPSCSIPAAMLYRAGLRHDARRSRRLADAVFARRICDLPGSTASTPGQLRHRHLRHPMRVRGSAARRFPELPATPTATPSNRPWVTRSAGDRGFEASPIPDTQFPIESGRRLLSARP